MLRARPSAATDNWLSPCQRIKRGLDDYERAVMGDLLSAWRSWQERRLILRDLRRHSADAKEVKHFKMKDQLTYAESALDNNDHRRATEILDKLIADSSSELPQFGLALRVLLRLRRYDEATTMMGDAQRRYPGEPRFLAGLAEIDQAKGNHDEAIVLYARLRKRFPGVMAGYTGAAESLRVLNRLDEAEALAKQALTQFQNEIHPCLEYARVAVMREDWEEALRRWQAVCDQFLYFGGYVGAAQALTHLGRHGEAEDLLQQARYRFGSDPGPLSEYARVAEAKGDIPEAVKRWQDVLNRFPLDMNVHFAASEAFERLGEPAEAEAALRAAIDRFPTELRPRLELAKLLQYRHRNFAAAADAWAGIRDVLPDNQEAYTSGADALRQAGRNEEAEALQQAYRVRFQPS
jgi:cytochrome c-type biogenesis protein CcmH/NrfG